MDYYLIAQNIVFEEIYADIRHCGELLSCHLLSDRIDRDQVRPAKRLNRFVRTGLARATFYVWPRRIQAGSGIDGLDYLSS
jgi:hypothetical protein